MQKRKRSATPPVTPPLTVHDPAGEQRLERAISVLSTAATALSQVTILYQSGHHAREGLLRAVDAITKAYAQRGKVIVCGVGKSALRSVAPP